MSSPARRQAHRIAPALRGSFAALVLLAACHPPIDPDENLPGDGGLASAECTDDLHCTPDGGDPALFRCNLSNYRCEAACRVREDCGVEARGEHALAFCEGPMGCQCQEGRCVQGYCTVDADCGGGVCRDGQCLSSSPAIAPARCELVPSFAVVPVGASLRFSLLARDASGQAIALTSGVEWTPEAIVAAPEPTELSQASFGFPTPTAGAQELVRATVGGVACAAWVHVLPVDGTPGIAQALLVDQGTGRPVAGAQLQLFGTLPDGGVVGPVEGLTDEQGQGRLVIDPELQEVTVSAYHAGFSYLTLVGQPVLGGAVELLLPLERDPVVGGFQAALTGVPASPHVHAAFTGDSRGPLLSLPNGLFGDPVPTDVSLGAWVEPGAPLPASVYLGSADGGIKTEVTVDATPGTCTTAPPGFDTAEEAMRAGRCGTTAAWAFSLDAPLLSLPLELLASGVTRTNWSSLFERSLPLLREFNSSVARDVEYPVAPTDGGTVGTYVPLELPFAQLPMRLRSVVRVPALPTYADRYLDNAVVLALAEVPGRGAVPLGLGLGVNRNLGDALTDPQEGLESQGLVSVKMAPAHHGLEGHPYALAATALWREGGPGERFGSSTILKRLGTVSLPYDSEGAQPISFDRKFLPLPERVHFNAASTGRQGLRPREVRLEPQAGFIDASFVRATFTGTGLKRWKVLGTPQRLVDGVELPTPPDGFADLLLDGAERARLQVEVVRLEDPVTAEPVSLAAFFDRTTATLERQRLLPVASAQVQHGRPGIEWVTPAEGATVHFGSELRARVRGLSLSLLGPLRRVIFELEGCGETWLQLASPDPSRPREVISVIPGGCEGPVQLVARVEALSEEGTWEALLPAVQATRAVTLSP